MASYKIPVRNPRVHSVTPSDNMANITSRISGKFGITLK